MTMVQYYIEHVGIYNLHVITNNLIMWFGFDVNFSPHSDFYRVKDTGSSGSGGSGGEGPPGNVGAC